MARNRSAPATQGSVPEHGRSPGGASSALKAIAAVLLASALLAAPAAAQDISGQWIIKRDVAVAVNYWRAYPDPCTSYRIETAPTPAYAETELGGCVQRWNPELWAWFAEEWASRPSAKRTEYLRWACVLTVHEFGHTVGLPDQGTNWRGIMYVGGGPSHTLRACNRAFPTH